MTFFRALYFIGLICLVPGLYAYSYPTVIDRGDSDLQISRNFTDSSCKTKNGTSVKCCVNYDVLICLEAQYLPKDIGVRVALSVNNKVIWSEEISETSPPEICPFDLPKVAEVCLKFYDLQIKQSHFCLNMTVKLDVIHRIPLRKIHIGCFDWNKELPKPLDDCVISNLTDSSFGLKCRHESNRNEIYSLEVVQSIDVVKNETHSTPNFVITELSPGTTYTGFVFAQNKVGYSQPVKYNITTKESPVLGRVMANAVVNVYTMYILLFVFTLMTLGLIVNIVVKRTCLNKTQSTSFEQMKDDLAHKLLPENDVRSCQNIVFE